MRPHRALLHPNIDMIYGGSCVERSNNNPGQAAPNTRHEMDGETGAEQSLWSWGVAKASNEPPRRLLEVYNHTEKALSTRAFSWLEASTLYERFHIKDTMLNRRLNTV